MAQTPSTELVENPLAIQRRVFYYRMHAGSDRAGRPVDWAPTQVLADIDILPFEEGRRCQKVRDSNQVALWIISNTPPIKLIFGTIRKGGWPLGVTGGERRGLSVPAGWDLLEQTHMILYRDVVEQAVIWTMGVENNYHGPRASALAWYLRRLAPNHCRNLEARALLGPSSALNLNRARSVKRFTLRVHRSFAHVLAETDKPMGVAVAALSEIDNGEEIEFTVSPRPFSRECLGGMVSRLRRLLGQEGFRENCSRLSADLLIDATGRIETVDLLRDDLASEERMFRQSDRTRAVTSDSAFAAIEGSYRRLRADLLSADEVAT